MSEYTKPKCHSCGEEIGFVQLENSKTGEIKAHPVESDQNYMIVATNKKTEKGQYIYKSVRIFTSHFKNCPAAIAERNKKEEEKLAKAPEEEAPPF